MSYRILLAWADNSELQTQMEHQVDATIIAIIMEDGLAEVTGEGVVTVVLEEVVMEEVSKFVIVIGSVLKM